MTAPTDDTDGSAAPPIGPGPTPTLSTVERLPRTSSGTHAGAFSATDWGLLLACAGIWGSSFYFMAIGLRSLEPGVITFLRIALGAVALAALPAARRRVRREDWPRIAVLGATWMAIPFTLFPLAEQRISSSLTGMLNAAMPVMTAVVALLMTRHLPGRLQAIGLAVGLAGTLAIGSEGFGEGGASAVGVAMVLVAVASYAVSVNIAVPLQQRYGSLPILVRIQMVAMVLTAPFALVGLPESSWELQPVLATVVLGVFGTGLAFAAMGTLIGRVGATRASVSTYLMPIVSVSLGAALLDETIHPSAVLGTVLVLLGAWLVSRAERLGT